MEKSKLADTTNRRKVSGALGTGAAAMSIATLAPLQHLNANPGEPINDDDPDEWFKKITGKHKVVFDATKPHVSSCLLFGPGFFWLPMKLRARQLNLIAWSL